MAKPPTNSFVSAKGPSVTANFPSDNRTRAPKELGRQPSVESSQPAVIASSINLPILSISCWLGGAPSALPDLYKHKNLIVVILSCGFPAPASAAGFGSSTRLQWYIEPALARIDRLIGLFEENWISWYRDGRSRIPDAERFQPPASTR